MRINNTEKACCIFLSKTSTFDLIFYCRANIKRARMHFIRHKCWISVFARQRVNLQVSRSISTPTHGYALSRALYQFITPYISRTDEFHENPEGAVTPHRSRRSAAAAGWSRNPWKEIEYLNELRSNYKGANSHLKETPQVGGLRSYCHGT